MKTEIQLLNFEQIKSPEYSMIQNEFINIWLKLFLKEKTIDRRLSGRFIKRYPKIENTSITAHTLLRSNQLWAPRLWEYPWAILNSYLEPNYSVLDVGCGWSLFPLYLAGKARLVSGLDIPGVIKLLNPVIDALDININYLSGSVTDIPFKDAKFDVVYCISTLEHIDHSLIIKAIYELLRVTVPGGRLILTFDYGENSRSLNMYSISRIAESLGYTGDIGKFRLTDEYNNELRNLWLSSFPYECPSPMSTAIGMVIEK